MDRRAVIFALVLTVAFTSIELIAVSREGAWQQVPSWDSAWFHTLAIWAKRSFEVDGIRGLIDTWAHRTGAHAPLVPVVSGLIQWGFGESRAAAESVLVLGTFCLALGTFLATSALYDRRTGYLATVLTLTTPTVLSLSRLYLFEHPFAGLFALAMAALIISDGFARWRPTIAFGVLSGLACVTRSGAAVLLIGPTIVGLIVALKKDGIGARIARLLIATGIALAIAATYYAPNLATILQHIRRVSYGDEAAHYSGGNAFSMLNGLLYLESNIVEGFGVPLFLLTLTAFAVAVVGSRGTWARSRIMLALALAWWIDFFLLLGAAQHVGARYFEALMPLIAIGVVRSVEGIPWRRTKMAFGAAVAVAAIHHVYGMTLGFSVPHASFVDGTAFIGPFRAWTHRSSFLDAASDVGMKDPRADMRIPSVVDCLESAGLAPQGSIYVLADHPFFQVNAMRLEAVRRGHEWNFESGQFLRDSTQPEWLHEIRRHIETADVVVVREGGISSGNLGDYADKAKLAFEGLAVPMTPPCPTIELADGSRARVLRRSPAVDVVSQEPEGLARAKARFEGGRIEFEGSRVTWSDQAVVVTICLRSQERPQETPYAFVHLLDGERILASRDFPPIAVSRSAVPEHASWWIVIRATFTGEVVDGVFRKSGDIGFGLLRDSTVRFQVERSDFPVDDGGTRIRIAVAR